MAPSAQIKQREGGWLQEGENPLFKRHAASARKLQFWLVVPVHTGRTRAPLPPGCLDVQLQVATVCWSTCEFFPSYAGLCCCTLAARPKTGGTVRGNIASPLEWQIVQVFVESPLGLVGDCEIYFLQCFFCASLKMFSYGC